MRQRPTLTLKGAERAEREDKARRDLLSFVHVTHPGYKAGWVHRDIARRLQRFSEAVRRGESPRLILSMPPQHGKSVLVERLLAFHLGHAPHHHVICASYSQRVTRKRSKHMLGILSSKAYQRVFPGTTLKTTAVDEWELDQGGEFTATSVGGSATSFTANVFVIDDPVKDWQEAYSPLKRERAWDWYASVAATRQAAEGACGIVIIQTRWHTDDLTGRLLDRAAGEDWEYIVYPAIAEADEHDEITGDLLRSKGEALHPERYTLEHLEKIHALDKWKWYALYQQRPTSPAGTVWKRDWFPRWTLEDPTPEQADVGWRRRPEYFEKVIVSLDASGGSQSQSASYCDILVLGRSGGRLFLLEERRGRWEYVALRAQLVAIIEKWHPHITYVENASNGRAIIQELQTSQPSIEPVPAVGSKESRAHAAAPRLEELKVLLPAANDSIDVADFLHEVCNFPGGAVNDDRVDTLGQAIRAELNEAEWCPFGRPAEEAA